MLVLIASHGLAFDHSRILRVEANAGNTAATIFLDNGGAQPYSLTVDGTLAETLLLIEQSIRRL